MIKPDKPTPEWIVCRAEFINYRHGNKGYAQREDQSYIMGDDGEAVHMGYTWYFRCVEFPRLTFEDHIMHPAHDRSGWRVWCVDEDRVPDLEYACRALLCPPLLTLPEYLVLERIGDFPCDHYDAINRAAGAVNPTPNFIEGRWSQVSQCIDKLRAKGILRYNSGTDKLEIAT